MPFLNLGNAISDTGFNLLLFFATSSVGIYGIILSG
jgi:hypothetical protein